MPLFNLQTKAILLNIGPKTTFQLGQERDLLLPEHRPGKAARPSLGPAQPSRRPAAVSSVAEKLQFVCAYVWTLSMLSCLQVNLSWGVCHGSSCFCI